ncbi:MAG: aminopeptidase P family N-terminal domain-containing protein, partial [Gemmataceae bacterium]|nr:aminopeptidase P family N-terminal domain-containing protein [Gemmataceae bacterium]
MAGVSPFDHAARREKLRALLPTLDLETMVVSRGVHVRYLTGFSGDSTVLLVGRSGDLVVSDGRYTEQLARECPGLEVHVR